MKVEKAVGLMNLGWLLVTEMVPEKAVAGGGIDPAYLGGKLVSPHEVPDSTDPVYHRLKEHGGGPALAAKTKQTLDVPPTIVKGLIGSSILVGGEGKDGVGVYAAAGVAANKQKAA